MLAWGWGGSHCELIAKHGAWVFVADIDEQHGKETVELIQAQGGKANFIKLDVSQQEDWDIAVQTITDIAGRLDVLVNNAGILYMKPVLDTTLEEWDKTMNINVRSIFIGTQAVAPQMKKQSQGVIINVSSIYGIVGAPGAAAYQASKGAVRLFTKACAVDLAPYNIRVNSVHPGVIETRMTKEILDNPKTRSLLLGPTLLQRPAQAN